MPRNPAERENNPIFISPIFRRILSSEKAVFTRADGYCVAVGCGDSGVVYEEGGEGDLIVGLPRQSGFWLY